MDCCDDLDNSVYYPDSNFDYERMTKWYCQRDNQIKQPIAFNSNKS